MKKSILALATVIVAAATTSCKTEEQKATELIKQELSRVLYDFGSYEPIETVITEAKHIPINDSICANRALDAITYRDLIKKNLEDAESSLEMMKLRQYSKLPWSRNDLLFDYKFECKSTMKMANIYIEKFNSSIYDLNMRVKNINPNVDHSFPYIREILLDRRKAKHIHKPPYY